jgi:hypothetical protein
MSFRYAWRIGDVAANSRPHTVASAITPQKLSTTLIMPMATTLKAVVAISAEAR